MCTLHCIAAVVVAVRCWPAPFGSRRLRKRSGRLHAPVRPSFSSSSHRREIRSTTARSLQQRQFQRRRRRQDSAYKRKQPILLPFSRKLTEMNGQNLVREKLIHRLFAFVALVQVRAVLESSRAKGFLSWANTTKLSNSTSPLSGRLLARAQPSTQSQRQQFGQRTADVAR